MGRLGQRRDLGVHSGMISDGLIDLAECGALTNARQSLQPGVMVTAEVAGTRRLFDWVHRNPGVRMAPAGYSHGRPSARRLPAPDGDPIPRCRWRWTGRSTPRRLTRAR